MCERHVVRVSAVIFDMDGVITDTMPYHYQAWKTAFAEILQKDITERDIYIREGSKGSFALREIFEQYGWPWDAALLEKLLRRKEEIFHAVVETRFIPGALDFLATLRENGFKTALVTGTSREEFTRMLPSAIRQGFDAVVTGSDVANGKPHPEPYLTALKTMGLPAGSAVVLENAPLGIRSAKAAGLTCIALATSLDAAFLNDADFVFSSYTDLHARIKFVVPRE